MHGAEQHQEAQASGKITAAEHALLADLFKQQLAVVVGVCRVCVRGR